MTLGASPCTGIRTLDNIYVGSNDFSREVLTFMKISNDFSREVLKFMKISSYFNREVWKFMKISSQKHRVYDTS